MHPFCWLVRIIIMGNLRNLFKKLKDIEPSRGLEGRILQAIAVENSRKVARKLMYARAGLAVTFGALLYSLLVFGRSFLQSDFWNLVKLVFTDTGIIAGHIGDYSISLLETLPVVEIFAILVPVFVLTVLFSYYFKFTNNNHYNHLIH